MASTIHTPELKLQVHRQLEASGVLAGLKAQLRNHVIDALSTQPDQAPEKVRDPVSLGIVAAFLKEAGLKQTLNVLLAESKYSQSHSHEEVYRNAGIKQNNGQDIIKVMVDKIHNNGSGDTTPNENGGGDQYPPDADFEEDTEEHETEAPNSNDATQPQALHEQEQDTEGTDGETIEDIVDEIETEAQQISDDEDHISVAQSDS